MHYPFNCEVRETKSKQYFSKNYDGPLVSKRATCFKLDPERVLWGADGTVGVSPTAGKQLYNDPAQPGASRNLKKFPSFQDIQEPQCLCEQ